MASPNEGPGGRWRHSRSIAKALQRGEPEAAEQVRDRVRRIVAFRGYGISAQDREDLVQEVMAQLWQAVSKPSFDCGGGFWGFVETVAARRCIDWWRTRRQTLPLDPGFEDGSRGPLAGALARERSRQVVELLAQMPKPCRDLVLMRFSVGKSYSELSRLLDKSEGALRVQLHRCLMKLRDLLEERKLDEVKSSLESEA